MGGEFKGKIPTDAHGRDYAYSDAATGAPFLVVRMDVVCLERLQTVPMGPLGPTDLAGLDAPVMVLGGFKLMILDPRNHASYHHGKLVSTEAPATLLPNFLAPVGHALSIKPARCLWIDGRA